MNTPEPHYKFNPKKLEKLNNPERLKMIPPEYIWQSLNPAEHDDKLEIGAGTAVFSLAFQKLSGRGTTTAVDSSELMVDWMRENIVPDNPEIIPLLTDGTTVPVKDESADLVYMITVHHELDDQPGMLREAKRILRKNRKIFIVDWNMNDTEHGPAVEHRCYPADVADQLKAAGFGDVRIFEGMKDFFLVTACT